MIRAHQLVEAPADPSAAILTARLSYDERHRRRFTVTATNGERVLIDLPEAHHLRGGDRLAMDDGRLLLVEAEPEPVADIVPFGKASLARLAWHLGNRHAPAAILDDRLRIRRDHVLEAMAVRLGARVHHVVAPFDPEPGAYHGEGRHDHHHAAPGDRRNG